MPDSTELRRQLREAISEAFSLEELQVICYDFKVDHENYDSRKLMFVRGMLEDFSRRNELKTLLERLAHDRPRSSWGTFASLYQDTSQPEAPLQISIPGDTPPTISLSTTPLTPVRSAVAPFDLETMRLIPAGQLLQASGNKLILSEFYIDTFPVTNLQFARFVDATGLRCRNWEQSKNLSLHYKANHPAVGISWFAAQAYAEWVGKRLSTALEWERAASGNNSTRYPWGNNFETNRCNTQESNIGETTSVDQYASGKCTFGVFDLSGNTWEWTGTEIKPRSLGKPGMQRVLKGGSWKSPATSATCASEIRAWPDEELVDVGFRCVW